MHPRELGDMVLGLLFIVFVVMCVCQPWQQRWEPPQWEPWQAVECERLTVREQAGVLSGDDAGYLRWLREVHSEYCPSRRP